jgi:hypothetical protein
VALADTVTLGASKDNTLFESTSGNVSNGSGQYFFAGRTNQGSGSLRRGLIAFDIAASVPAGATITNVTLRLNNSRTISAEEDVALHRVLADWGEGISDALDQEGIGAPAQAGDATWLHRFFPGTRWASAGGDFDPSASAVTEVGGTGPYAWTSPQMAADVQSWLDDPATNFGWLLLGHEAILGTAKRFDSRESPTAELRPQLDIEFEPRVDQRVPALMPWGLVALALALAAGGCGRLRMRRVRATAGA